MSESEEKSWDQMLDAILKKITSSAAPISIGTDELPAVSKILTKSENINPLKEKLPELKAKLQENSEKLTDDGRKLLDDDGRKLLVNFISACEKELARWDRKLDAIIAKDGNEQIKKEDLPEVSETLLDLREIKLLKEKLKDLKTISAKKPNQSILSQFISACEKELARWDLKLDAILVKSSCSVTVDELPTAIEIVSDPKNIPLLKVKLERLKYWFHSNPNDSDLWLLKSFIENCEREIAKIESKKTKYKFPWALQINFWVIAFFWIAASVVPAICYHRFFHSQPLYFKDQQSDNTGPKKSNANVEKPVPKNGDKKDGKTTATGNENRTKPAPEEARPVSEKPQKVYCNWGTLLAAVVAVLVYLAFYAILSVVLFRALKSLLVHRHRQLIGEDLPSLVKVLTAPINRDDPVQQEARKCILKILMRDHYGE